MSLIPADNNLAVMAGLFAIAGAGFLLEKTRFGALLTGAVWAIFIAIVASNLRIIPASAPAYDFVSTIPYIQDEQAGLKFSRTKRFDEFTLDELAHLAARAMLPEKLVLDTARETVALFHQNWQTEKANLPLRADVIKTIEAHVRTIPL